MGKFSKNKSDRLYDLEVYYVQLAQDLDFKIKGCTGGVSKLRKYCIEMKEQLEENGKLSFKKDHHNDTIYSVLKKIIIVDSILNQAKQGLDLTAATHRGVDKIHRVYSYFLSDGMEFELEDLIPIKHDQQADTYSGCAEKTPTRAHPHTHPKADLRHAEKTPTRAHPHQKLIEKYKEDLVCFSNAYKKWEVKKDDEWVSLTTHPTFCPDFEYKRVNVPLDALYPQLLEFLDTVSSCSKLPWEAVGKHNKMSERGIYP